MPPAEDSKKAFNRNCYVAGEYNGFYGCNNIISSMAYNCAQAGFWQCGRISACQVDGNGVSVYGFYVCANGSGCHVENCTFDEYHACTHFSTHTDGSCD